MTKKHTREPWTINHDFKIPVIGYDVGDGGDLLPIVDVVHGMDIDQATANIHLIAASPALLRAAKAALYEMRNTVATRNSFTDATDELSAAIATAEGTAA